MIRMCPGPDPNPRPPRWKAPPGATDTHCHIFGPQDRYLFVADRRFTPAEATVASYLHLHRTLGLSRAVLVQPSGYGVDNRRQLDAAREMDIQTRVIVVLASEVTDREIENLHRAGARGVRFVPTQPGGLALSELERFGDRFAPLGWHIQLMLGPEHLVELAPRLLKLRCDFVIDQAIPSNATVVIAKTQVHRIEHDQHGLNGWVVTPDVQIPRLIHDPRR